MEASHTFEITDQEMNRILSVIVNAKFYVQDAPQTYRQIQHYEEKGLLNKKEPGTNKWRVLNAVEVIWLNIINQLREFGLPLPAIKQLKDKLFENGFNGVKRGDNYEAHILEWISALCVNGKTQYYLIVLPTGQFTFFSDSSAHLWNEENSYLKRPHISLPLSHIIEDFWSQIPDEEKLIFKMPNFVDISKPEKSLLDELRSGNYNSVTVTMKNAEPYYFEGLQNIDTQKDIMDLLRSADHQDITLKKHDGRLVKVIQSVKKHL